MDTLVAAFQVVVDILVVVDAFVAEAPAVEEKSVVAEMQFGYSAILANIAETLDSQILGHFAAHLTQSQAKAHLMLAVMNLRVDGDIF